jgi:hypothetical protein
MEMKKASKIRKIWFWLTCWRPTTKYEYVKIWEFLMKFGMAIEKDHMKFHNDIQTLNKRVEIKDTQKENENTERGMYL